MSNPQGTLQLPPQMSTVAPEVDDLYNVIYWVSVVAFVAIVGVMLAYVWKYRYKPGVKAEPTGHNTALEIFWTFTPLFLLAYLFHQGFSTYLKEQIAPAGALEIRVQGQQWSWAFEHPNGAVETNELHVPSHRPVRLIMSSVDVLHSLYVPEFRLKRDVVPGIFTTMWFEATQETPENRPITLFCAEYCGAPIGIRQPDERTPGHIIDNQNSNHSTMLATIHVMTDAAYRGWLANPPPPPECAGKPAEEQQACWGEVLYRRNGCTGCHSTEAGRDRPAPSWSGIWGRTAALEGGASRTVDEAYIAQSIRQPQSEIVQGYGSINMPPYRMSDTQINALIAFMKTLR